MLKTLQITVLIVFSVSTVKTFTNMFQNIYQGQLMLI